MKCGDDAKIALIEKYFGTQFAPETQQVTSKTYGSTVIVGNSKKIHSNATVEKNDRDYWMKYLTPTHWFTVMLSGVGTWMANSTMRSSGNIAHENTCWNHCCSIHSRSVSQDM